MVTALSYPTSLISIMASTELIDRIRLSSGAEVLADQLRLFLEVESGFVSVNADEEKGYYAQYAINTEGELHGEIVSNDYLDPEHRLTREEISEIQARGWQTESDFGNYIRSWPRPLTEKQIVEAASTALEALVQVYGVAGSQVAQIRTVLEDLDQDKAEQIEADHVTHQPR